MGEQRGSQKAYWIIFGVTYVAYSVIYITRKNFSVVKTLIQDDVGLSTYLLGTIDSVFLSTYAIFQIFLPSFSDVYGIRPLVLCSFFGAALCSFLFSVGNSPEVFIIAWFAEGIAHASVFPVFIKTLSLWFRTITPTVETSLQRHHSGNDYLLGLWTTSQQVGGILATTVATYFSTAPGGDGWRNSFRAAGGITAATGTMLYFLLLEPLPIAFNLATNTKAHVPLRPAVSPDTTNEKADVESAWWRPADVRVVRSEGIVSTTGVTAISSSVSDVPSVDEQDNSTFVSQGITSGNEAQWRRKRLHEQGNKDIVGGSSVPAECFKSKSTAIKSPGSSIDGFNSDSSFQSDSRSSNNGKRSITTGASTRDVQRPAYPDVSVVEMRDLDAGEESERIPSLGDAACPGLHTMNCSKKDLPHMPPASLTFFQVVLLPGLLPCGAAYFCVKVVRYALLFWLPFFLVTELNLTPTVAGYSSMLFEVGGVAGALLSGFIVNRIFRGRRLTAAASLCILSSLILFLGGYLNGYTTSNAVADKNDVIRRQLHMDVRASEVVNAQPGTTLLVMITLIGLLLAGPDSILGATAAMHLCETSGVAGAQAVLSTATGIVNGLGALGGVAQSYMIATVAEMLGWSAVFMLLSVFSLAGAITLVPATRAERFKDLLLDFNS